MGRWPLVLVVAVVAGACNTSARQETKATTGGPDVLARYAPPPVPPEVRARVQSMLDVRSPDAGEVSLDGRTMFFTWSVTGTSQVWRLDGPQRFPVQLTGGEDVTAVAGVMPDGRHVVVSRDRGGAENPGLYLQPAGGGSLEVIVHKDQVRAFLSFISNDGKSIYYRANDRKADAYAIYRYDVATKGSELVFDQDGLWDVADHRPDGRLLLVKETGSTSRESYEFDLATKALTPVLGQGEAEDYQASFGAESGELLVLTPRIGDFRRLYRFRQGQLVPVTPEMPHDVSVFSIDESRRRILYIVNDGGYSRLGAMDARTFTELPLPALPAADHVRFGATTSDGRYTTLSVDTGRVADHGVRDPEKDRDALVKLSPITYVDRVKAPLLVVQGANDPRVPVSEATQIHEALAAKKIDSLLIVFPDEGHGSQKRDNRVLERGHILQFFQKRLAG